MSKTMNAKSLMLRPIAAWTIVAGLLTLVTAFLLTFYFRSVSSVLGFMLLLVVVFVAAYEMGAFRSLWIAQVGEWGNILKSLAFSLPFRFLFIWMILGVYNDNMSADDRTIADWLLILNVITLLIEVMGMTLVFVKKKYFLPPREEVEAVMKRIQTTGLKSLSNCPTCGQMVEADWCCCPNCGTTIQKFCASCNADVTGCLAENCPACGIPLVSRAAIEGLIATLKETAELDGSAETKSMRYARYAEALLKGGKVDEALEAYRKAIHFTKFARKQTNFMVKMATIYDNAGQRDRAIEMLDAAMKLDDDDWAGAKKHKEDMLSQPEKKVCVVKA